MSRRKVQCNIDKEVFEKLCAFQCTQAEIADWFRLSHDSVERWCKKTYGVGYSEVYATYRSHGKISLRRSQWQQAEKNPTMAIWLGKQYLGQKDEQTVNQNITPIVIKDDLSEEE